MLLFRLNGAIVGVVITPYPLECRLSCCVTLLGLHVEAQRPPFLFVKNLKIQMRKFSHLVYSHRYSECTIMYAYKNMFVIF